ncbi:hypothetical protein RM533_01775 [Croceicoccus sp. F390]|uniref:Uncharacterized protein n=1 Tax=Croceicoccus esteveae TaxID=3075597 RepID=A0ABU2ZF31_9SPHN|nr:hypothetical protein [Croceicoccus sp. F390]MDT0574909.1 hypothetical protein [Croceicoccus sp. F390]
MKRQGDRLDVTTTEARSGSTPNIVRWVLIISMILIVGGMSVIWITGALSTDDAESIAPVTNQTVPPTPGSATRPGPEGQ